MNDSKRDSCEIDKLLAFVGEQTKRALESNNKAHDMTCEQINKALNQSLETVTEKNTQLVERALKLVNARTFQSTGM